MSRHDTEDQALTQQLTTWTKNRRDTLKHGFPDERTRDRRDPYEPALDVIEKIITLTAGWLYNGPHDDPLGAGLAIAVLDSAACEIRELLTETLTFTEVTP